MSNANVGGVYDHIIQEVINAVRVDFEENGVDDGVLEELKKGWQHKLSQLNVAQFPWDPKPEPTPAAPPLASANVPQPAAAAAAAPAPPAASTYTQSTLSPPTHGQPLSLPAGRNQNSNGVKSDPRIVKNEPVIKQEPGLNGGPAPALHPGYSAASAPPRPGMAAQRAALALESQYGERAAASISAIHSGMAMELNQGGQQQPQQIQQQHPQQQQQQHLQQHLQQQHHVQQQQQHVQHQQHPQQHPQQQQFQQGPRPGQVPQQMTQQQYRQGIASQQQLQAQQRLQAQQAQAQQAQAQQQLRPPNGLPAAQVDGAGDAYDGVLMWRGADGRPVEMGRVEIDNLLHAQMAARAKQMEGGGLMLPLKQATKVRSVASKKRSAGGAQMDGGDDDLKEEELDNDAINSDLDDSEDPNDDDEDDDESMGHMMLCMYDKVQRVKNKWKCTLKDGVLTVNGREYVFHKATGEYEW
ncbi:transcription factor IIA, alpha/beta subunit [Bombardia bombarda]|uniref:Transcription initiation factor IIA large subunit n=1 Tax=Bombardia bombarda TaxID=252184 RepID=A0AA39WMK5_9PEZI|nr:transcription factor IIA, alpha/beta subunit [Bombardia bombarda]